MLNPEIMNELKNREQEQKITVQKYFTRDIQSFGDAIRNGIIIMEWQTRKISQGNWRTS